MEWTETLPTSTGRFIVKVNGQWPIYLVDIERGNWQKAQNPEWLYFNENTPLHEVSGVWFGPIPDPPKA